MKEVNPPDGTWDPSQQILYKIINHLPHSIFWKDAQSVFLGCNKVFYESAGFTSSRDVIGKTDYDMPWSREESLSYIEDDQLILTSGVARINYEERQTQKDGSEKIVLVSKVPLYNQQNEPIAILGIFTDITDRKRMEHSLFQAKQMAETANQLKTEFIRNMEHDIRTPFTGIYGIAKILLDMETDQQKKDFLSDIVSCSKELLEYSTGILNFSLIESGSIPIVSKKFDLFQLIDGLVLMEAPAAKVKSLEFSSHCEPDLPTVIMGDRYRLQRVLINLVSNAIKFTKTGFVKLSAKVAKRVDSRNIIISFLIEDSGMGISEEKQNIIFERFARLVPSNQGLYQGQGLGLRLVKQFVEEMDGDIEIHSKEGVGSTFVCTFPFKLPLVDDIASEG